LWKTANSQQPKANKFEIIWLRRARKACSDAFYRKLVPACTDVICRECPISGGRSVVEKNQKLTAKSQRPKANKFESICVICGKKLKAKSQRLKAKSQLHPLTHAPTYYVLLNYEIQDNKSLFPNLN
jgi:hypothetical protein